MNVSHDLTSGIILTRHCFVLIALEQTDLTRVTSNLAAKSTLHSKDIKVTKVVLGRCTIETCHFAQQTGQAPMQAWLQRSVVV